MKRRGLLNKHFCENKIQISPLRQKKLSIFTFPIMSIWKIYVAIATRLLIRPEPKTQLIVPPTYRCYMCNMKRIGFTASEEKSFTSIYYKLTYEPSAQVSRTKLTYEPSAQVSRAKEKRCPSSVLFQMYDVTSHLFEFAMFYLYFVFYIASMV